MKWCSLQLGLAAALSAAVWTAASADVFRVATPPGLFAGAPVARMTKADARRLLDVPVRFGAEIAGVHEVKAGRPDRTVATCRQYAAAQRDGFEWTNNFENKMSGFLVRACGVLDAVLRARPARRSEIDVPPVGMRDVGVLSAAVLPRFPWEPASDPNRSRDRSTVAEFIRRNDCRVVEATAVELRITCRGMLLAVEELLRADLDGDGFQDILVSPYIGSTEGTFSFTAPLLVLSRTSPHGLLVPRPLPTR